MNLNELVRRIVEFRDARDWQQFHSPDQLAKAISIEAAELLEHFLWKSPEQVHRETKDPDRCAVIGDEIADILIFSLLLTHQLALDPAAIVSNKLMKNAAKYPVEKSRGTAKKYTEL